MIWGLVAMVIVGIMGIALIALSPEGDAIINEPLIASAPIIDDEAYEWSAYYVEAFNEYADEFTALFNAMEYKRAKNGASMIRRPGDKSFKFVAKGN